MIKHIVMWKLKDEAEGGTRIENGLKMQEMLHSLRGKIDTLKHLEVSVKIEDSLPEADIVLYSEFDSMEDLKAYATHPLHVDCVAFIKSVVESRYVVDYEV